MYSTDWTSVRIQFISVSIAAAIVMDVGRLEHSH